ncbi:hypothetical protein ACW17M_03970 [Vreelandella sp. 2A-K22]
MMTSTIWRAASARSANAVFEEMGEAARAWRLWERPCQKEAHQAVGEYVHFHVRSYIGGMPSRGHTAFNGENIPRWPLYAKGQRFPVLRQPWVAYS